MPTAPTSTPRWRRALRDPLLHFAVAGGALFVLYGAVAGDAGERPDRIVVTEARLASLAQGFERTWMRPPNPAELRDLAEEYVIEEMLYREALALGLDRNDLVVRRRMRQKMEFLTEDLAAVDPTEEELAAFLREEAERFEIPARLDFAQVFVDPQRSGEDPEARVAALLQRLRSGADPASLGDATLLPASLEQATPNEIARRFGKGFAEGLAGAPEGAWYGPLTSEFGLHLVRVDARVPARAPQLAEVRARVERELLAQRREQARTRLQSALRERYEVVFPAALEASAPAP